MLHWKFLVFLALISISGCDVFDYTKERNVHFVTYGNEKFRQSRERIAQEARDTGWFRDVKIYTPENIGDEYTNKYGDFVNSHPRGGGYWLWKPYIIWQHLKTMADGDFLVYFDSGGSINSQGKNRLNEYLKALDGHPSGVLGFQMNFVEKCFTKSDLAEDLGTLTNSAIMDSGQVMATIVIMQKNANSLAFAERWFKEATKNNFRFLDDQPSVLPNDGCYHEHRHDQSIFSLLIKLEGGVLFPDEIQYYSNSRPFRATRIRN